MSGTFRFGEFELDVAAYTLRRAGQRIKLEKIPMEVLVLLVQQAGILVNRTEIRAALWGSDVFVDQDAAINTAIRKSGGRLATRRNTLDSSRRSSARATGSLRL